MAREEKRARRRRKRGGGLLPGLILVVLLFGLGVQLYRIQDQLQSARDEKNELTRQISELEETNQEPEEDIANSDDPEMIERIAREELGMVVQGEKVFYNIGG